jgi:hypothetical protein
MFKPIPDQNIIEALDVIIQGRSVTRKQHELTLNGHDVTALFLERLTIHGYTPQTVGKISCEPGERIPAFYLEGVTAYFGWIFWERFTS